MDNIALLKYSLKNREIFEDVESKEKIIITSDAKFKNETIKNNERLIDLITTYHTMCGKFSRSQEDAIIEEIDSILFKTKYMNYSAFSQYLMVWDMPYSVLCEEEKPQRKKLLRELMIKYIHNRHQMYKSHGYSNIVLQVVSDNYAHKRGGSTGTNKIIELVEQAGFTRFHKNNDIYKDSFYLLPDKGDKRIFKEICAQKNIKFEWSKSKQDKMPDFYIQKASNVYIIEHKHKKGGGGGQYSQIVEMVDFVKYAEKDVYYVAFLDGILFNELINASGNNKIAKAEKDICKYLNKNKNNYFVNTAGFVKLLQGI